MVLSHIADKLGLWEYIAPQQPKSKRKTPQQEQQEQQENQDAQLAQKIQQEENHRFQRLQTQHELEKKAEERNQFAKWQRVLYYSKIDDMMIEAVVVGVHFDDGPDKPYYTIKYKKIVNVEGSDNVDGQTTTIDMEKQTNGDRLTRQDWDENKTWVILKK